MLCLGMTSQMLAQNIGINTTGAAPDNSALLDISSSNKGMLIPQMDSTARKNIMNPAKGLMVFDSTYNNFYFYDGKVWSAAIGGGNDNLGNHVVKQNLQLANNWLSNDGGTNEGVYIDSIGQLGIQTEPAATFHASMGKFIEANASNTDIDSGFPIPDDLCQSFTMTKTGELHSIQLIALSSGAVTYNLYEGTGTGGTLLAGPLNQANAQDLYLFSGITLTQGQVYTIEVLNPGGIFFEVSDEDPYPGGRMCMYSGLDYWFVVNLQFDKPGFRINDTLVQFNNYNLPIADGTSGQALSTDGSGNVDWLTTVNTDNQDLSRSGNTLSLTNDATPVDLSPYLDNTDAQDLSHSGTSLSVTNDATPVDLSGYMDNTDVQDLSRSGNTLSLTNDATTVDLSPYLDNTDVQDLSLSGNTLSLTNDASTVDLSPYLDNTDAQDLSLLGNILSLTNDASTIDLTPLLGADDLGSHTATQNLRLNGNWLNNDGGANEGLNIDNTGQVGINTIPAAKFHIDLGSGNNFQINDAGVTLNQYTLPNDVGSADDALTTDGSGNVSWAVPLGSADNLGDHTASQNIQLNGNWLSNDGGNEGIIIDNSGKIGVGRGVGSVGNAKVEFYGTNTSLAGPHIQVVNSVDDYPSFQQLNWSHENIALSFDAYYDGNWRSSSNNSNFSIYKIGGTLYNYYAKQKAKGTAFTWSIGTALHNSGRFGIGRNPVTNKLEVEGDASKVTAGNWLANSDARLKKNISPLSSQEMLDKLLALQGVTYEWNDNKTNTQRPEGIQFGFTAQNIQEVFPRLVTEDNQGYLQTPYDTYDAMTVEALRELNDKILQLEKEKASLHAEVQDLQLQNQQIENHSAELLELKAAFTEFKSTLENN